MRVMINAVSAKMGGAANYIRTLARELAETDDHVYLFLVPDNQAAAIRKLAPHIRVLVSDVAEQSPLRRLWFDQVELPRLLQREHIDVLFSTANFATFLCPCRQLLLVRNSLYFSPLYRAQILPYKRWKTRIGEALRRWVACRSAMAADVVLTPSQAMLDELRSAVSIRAAQVSYYGVDRTRFRPASRPFAQDGTVRLLFTSLYAEHKNSGTLFRALPRLEESGEKCVLITTADPAWEKIHNPIRASDCALAAQLERRGVLQMTGMLSGEALNQLYSRADIFVYPSVVESFGHPLLEAMAAGLPVIAADVPVNRELCGDAALYFSPFDQADCARQIRLVIKDADCRTKLARTGQQRAEAFPWSSHVRTILQQFASSQETFALPIASHA